MKKDYFANRTVDTMYRSSIQIGELVYICEKRAQKYAKTVDDLTLIRVTRLLTSKPMHPRGQKVLGVDFTTGEEKTGRVVYLVKDGKILTTEGERYGFELAEKQFQRK